MIIISTRKDFVDADRKPQKFKIADIDLENIDEDYIENNYQLSLSISNNNFIEKIRNKKVLILVHGYNNNFETVSNTYNRLDQEFRRFNAYDEIIGFIWSGGDNSGAIFNAKLKVDKNSREFNGFLKLLSQANSTIDIIAHSLGNKIVFKALSNKFYNNDVIRYFFSLSAAVDKESIAQEQEFNKSTQTIKQTFVFYSKYDIVLRNFYRITDWGFDEALGHGLPEDLEYFNRINKKVFLVNSNNIVNKNNHRFGHFKYKSSDKFYSFLKKIINNEINLENNHFLTIK